MKIKGFIAMAAVTAWSGMAPAAFVTTFGQNKSADSSFPLTFYPEAVTARDNFLGGGAPNFFDFEAPEVAVGTSTLSVNLGGVVATLSGAGGVKRNDTGVTNSGLYSVSGVIDPDPSPQGNKYWEAIAPKNGVSGFKLEFDKAVQSFGFFATDVGESSGLLTLELTLMNNTTVMIQPGGAGVVSDGEPVLGDGGRGSVLFFGVKSIAAEYFKSVRFISSGGTADDPFGFDMFTVVAAPTGPNPTPLPGSLALVGAALGGLALVRRRR